jgi:WD40 repeat protein
MNKSNQKNKKIFMTIHPREPIMITVGEDKNLCLWDIEKNKLLNNNKKQLDDYPTCVKFSPDGDSIIVGFISGNFQILDSKIQKNAN